MDQKQIARQFIEFNKTAFDNSFTAMTVLQDQTEKLIYPFLEKSPWFSEERKKVIDEWINTCKRERKEFKLVTDESYKKVADYFVKLEKEASPKPERNNKKPI